MSGGIISPGNDQVNLSIARPPNPGNVTSFPGPPASSISRPQITDHPIFTQMLSLPGVTEDAAFRATIVYLDLFEKKQWWRVDFVLNERLSSIMLFGSATRNGECHVIIPVATETKLTIRNLRLFLKEGAKALDVVRNKESKTEAAVASTNTPPSKMRSSPSLTLPSPSSPHSSLSHAHSPPSNTKSSPSARSRPKVSLGIVSRDATLVFYQISDGLLLPQRPLNAAQRLERDSLRKLGKKGGPLVNEERQWVGDGIEAKKTSLPVQNELTVTKDTEEFLDINADGNLGVEVDNGGGGGNGGGYDWEEDTDGFWD